jgi:hypothetical protein
MKQVVLSILFVVLSNHVNADVANEVYKESLYSKYLKYDNKSLISQPIVEDIDLYIDAQWDLAHDSAAGRARVKKSLRYINFPQLTSYNKWRYIVLKNFTGLALTKNEYLTMLILAETPVKNDKRTKIFIASEIEIIRSMGLSTKQIEESTINLEQDTPDSEFILDVYNNNLNLNTYQNGRYKNGMKLFVFCRENRLFPCLMIMKNKFGEVVRTDDQTIWSQPSLGSSRHGLPYYVRNGNTPMGVYTVDSVMPEANNQAAFGKNRRLILNFIPSSKGERNMLELLPASSMQLNWWKESTVARDVGRNLLRIHGTGKINTDPQSTFYPLVQTSGCIAKRENTYDNITYNDQRELLDQAMTSLGLEAKFENEVQINGLLYLINIDNQESAVTIDDLRAIGIE